MAEYDNLESIIVAVEAGRGVAIIYEGVSGISGKRLVLRPLKPVPQPPTLVIAYRKEHVSATVAINSEFDLPEFAPRLRSEDYPFCEEGPFLAFKFLRTAHMILERHDVYAEEELRQLVNTALDELLGHLKESDNCKERQHTLKSGTFFDDLHQPKNARD